MSETIKRRERDAVLQSLQAGLVPKLGLHLIQVGRKQEVAALLSDLERIEQAGAAFRIVVGLDWLWHKPISQWSGAFMQPKGRPARSGQS